MVIPLSAGELRTTSGVRRADLPQNFSVSRLIAEMVRTAVSSTEARQYSSGRIGSPAFLWALENRAPAFSPAREES